MKIYSSGRQFLLILSIILGSFSAHALPKLEPVFIIGLSDTALLNGETLLFSCFDGYGRAYVRAATQSHVFSNNTATFPLNGSATPIANYRPCATLASGVAGSAEFGGALHAAVWDNPLTSPRQIHFTGVRSFVVATNGMSWALIEEWDAQTGDRVYKIRSTLSSAAGTPAVKVSAPPAPSGTSWVQMNAKAIGMNGEVAGFMKDSQNRTYPFFWTEQSGAVLLTGFPNTPAHGEALSVGMDGTIAGTLLDSQGRYVPAYWQAGSLSPQAVFRTSMVGKALFVRTKDQIVGWYEPSVGQKAGFYLYEGVAQNINRLASLTGIPFTVEEALSVSVNGAVALNIKLATGECTIALMVPGDPAEASVNPRDVPSASRSAKLTLKVPRDYGTPIRFSIRALSDGNLVSDALPTQTLTADQNVEVVLPIKPFIAPPGVVQKSVLRVTPSNVLWPDPFRVSSFAHFNILPIEPVTFRFFGPSCPLLMPEKHLPNGHSIKLDTKVKPDHHEASAFGLDTFISLEVDKPELVEFAPGRSSVNIPISTSVGFVNTVVLRSVGGVTKDTKVKIIARDIDAKRAFSEVEFTLRAPRVESGTAPNAKFNSESDFTVKIDTPAPKEGLKLSLSSNDHNMFQVPSSITIAAGQTSKTIKVKSGIGLIPKNHDVDVKIVGPMNSKTQRIVVELF